MVGRMEQVPLREVWKKEAKDFTSWLYENLDVLGEELDLELTPTEKEKSVGSFSADIVAEDSSGQLVLIENQLEKTDHTHLGQILTYISNLDAKIAIWISSEPRDEHIKAIEWLNETGSGVQFYIVLVEAYKIGDSEPAPKFTIKTGPSEKTAIVSAEKKEMAERDRLRYDFWKTFLERSKLKTQLHSNISPGIANWIGISSGVRGLGYNYAITNKYGQAELYIDRGKESDEENKRIFDELNSHRPEIEKDFGSELRWERLDDRRACRISKRIECAGLNDKEKWAKLQDDMIEAMIKLEASLKKHIKLLKI
ncbi:MAG: DUF4268 domain-containing protein [Candidatus Aureabacteria bacterium]|nr:DUF4268 domain-containing protein [Candidatus Auribacterota bacterium]